MNIGPMEVIMIFVVALLVFGPAKLPEIGRQVGRAVREFRKFQSSFQNEFRDLLDDPPPGPVITQQAPRPAGEGTAEAADTSPPAVPAAPAPPVTPSLPSAPTGPAGPVATGPAVPLRPVAGDDGGAPSTPTSSNGDGAATPPTEA